MIAATPRYRSEICLCPGAWYRALDNDPELARLVDRGKLRAVLSGESIAIDRDDFDRHVARHFRERG